MQKLLFFVVVLKLLSPSAASAKTLGLVKFHETESAYFYEKKSASDAHIVFFQPKLTVVWKEISTLSQGKLWQVNINFRSDVDFDEVKSVLPFWEDKIFVRDSIVAADNCRFASDVPGRFKAKLKHATAGKTFSGQQLCQFDVFTKLGDDDILVKLREMTSAGNLVDSGLEKISVTALEPDLPVSVEAVHQILQPHSVMLRRLDQATAQFALILAIGELKSEAMLAVIEKVDPELLTILQKKLFLEVEQRFDLRSGVENTQHFLGFRSVNKEVRL